MKEDSSLLTVIPSDVLYTILDYLPKTFVMSTLFLISKGTAHQIKKYIMLNYSDNISGNTDEEKYQNFIGAFKALTPYTRKLVLNKTYKLSEGEKISAFQKSGVYEKVRFFMEIMGCTFSVTGEWGNSENINIPFVLRKFYLSLNPIEQRNILTQQFKSASEKIKLVKFYCTFQQSRKNLSPLLDLLQGYSKELIEQFFNQYETICTQLNQITPIYEEEKNKIEEFQVFFARFKESSNNFPCQLDRIYKKIAEDEILSFWVRPLKDANNNTIDPFTLLYQMYVGDFLKKDDLFCLFENYSPMGTSDEEADFFNTETDFDKINLSRAFVKIVVSPDCSIALTKKILNFHHIKQIREKLFYNMNEIQNEEEKEDFVKKVSCCSFDDLIKNYIDIFQSETTILRN